MLLWLPAAFVTLYFFRTALKRPQGFRGQLALLLRLVFITVLIFSAAGFHLGLPSNRLCLLVLADMSDSVPKNSLTGALRAIASTWQDSAPPDSRIGLIAFGRGAKLDTPPSAAIDGILPTVQVDGTATDLAQAIRLAQATFPEGWGRRLLLLTDGRENVGEAALEVEQAARRGIEVWSWSLGKRASKEVLVDKLDVPSEVKLGEPLPIAVALQADHDGQGTLKLFANKRLIAEEEVTYHRGRTLLRFEDRARQPGVQIFTAEFDAPQEEGLMANNRGEAFCYTGARDSILYVHNLQGPSKHFLHIAKKAGFIVETRDIGSCPTRLIEFGPYAAVVLDDIQAVELGVKRQETIRRYVKETGGGLLVLGGPKTFGAGGYYKTPLEETLPVTMDVTGSKHRRAMALAIVVDISGSMSYTEQGVQKIDLANEGAVRAVELLHSGDLFGFVATNTQARWVVPLKKLTIHRNEVKDDILALQASGGGIYTYTGLAFAYKELEKKKNVSRHVLLFADTNDAEEAIGSNREHVYGLAERMLDKEISTSTVGIGHRGDRDIPLLRGIALRGGGRFYFTEDMFSIPALFSQETMLAARNVVVDEEFEPKAGNASPLLAGLREFPRLGGYIATTARPQATVALMSHRDEPLLAHWHYGVGRSVAFTSSIKGKWGKELAAWSNFGPFFVQCLRWLSRGVTSDGIALTASRKGGQVEVTADLTGGGGQFLNLAALDLRVIEPEKQELAYQSVVGKGQEEKANNLSLRQFEPGRYRATFPLSRPGTYVLSLQGALRDGERVNRLAAYSLPYSPEFENPLPDEEFLQGLVAMASGQVIRDGDGRPLTALPKSRASNVHPLWRALLMLAIILWIFDCATRRLNVSFSSLKALFIRESKEEMGKGEKTVGAALTRIRQMREGDEDEADDYVFTSKIEADSWQPKDPLEPIDLVELDSPPSSVDAPSSHEEEEEYLSRLLQAKKRAKK